MKWKPSASHFIIYCHKADLINSRKGPLLYARSSYNIICEHPSSALFISLTGGWGKMTFEESESMAKVHWGKSKSGTWTPVPWNLEISLRELQVMVLYFVNPFMELSPIARIASFLQNWHFGRFLKFKSTFSQVERKIKGNIFYLEWYLRRWKKSGMF